jgi:hypothetical protein
MGETFKVKCHLKTAVLWGKSGFLFTKNISGDKSPIQSLQVENAAFCSGNILYR